MRTSSTWRLASVAVVVLLATACGGSPVAPSASASAIAITAPPQPASPTASAITMPSPASSPTPSAIPSPSASPRRSAIVSPFRFEFLRNDGGGTVTIDVDDRSGLLVDIAEGGPFFTENPDNDLVVFLNDPADASILRVSWFASGGCADSYDLTIGPSALVIRIEGPPAGSDSIGGNCDVTLRFSEPVPAEGVEGALVDRR